MAESFHHLDRNGTQTNERSFFSKFFGTDDSQKDFGPLPEIEYSDEQRFYSYPVVYDTATTTVKNRSSNNASPFNNNTNNNNNSISNSNSNNGGVPIRRTQSPPISQTKQSTDDINNETIGETIDNNSNNNNNSNEDNNNNNNNNTQLFSQNKFISAFKSKFQKPLPLVEDKKFWMPDHSSAVCYECSTEFSTFKRRHHCRLCGQIFCWKCSEKTLVDNKGEQIRVCNFCYRRYMTPDDLDMEGYHYDPVTGTIISLTNNSNGQNGDLNHLSLDNNNSNNNTLINNNNHTNNQPFNQSPNNSTTNITSSTTTTTSLNPFTNSAHLLFGSRNNNQQQHQPPASPVNNVTFNENTTTYNNSYFNDNNFNNFNNEHYNKTNFNATSLNLNSQLQSNLMASNNGDLYYDNQSSFNYTNLDNNQHGGSGNSNGGTGKFLLNPSSLFVSPFKSRNNSNADQTTSSLISGSNALTGNTSGSNGGNNIVSGVSPPSILATPSILDGDKMIFYSDQEGNYDNLDYESSSTDSSDNEDNINLKSSHSSANDLGNITESSTESKLSSSSNDISIHNYHHHHHHHQHGSSGNLSKHHTLTQQPPSILEVSDNSINNTTTSNNNKHSMPPKNSNTSFSMSSLPSLFKLPTIGRSSNKDTTGTQYLSANNNNNNGSSNATQSISPPNSARGHHSNPNSMTPTPTLSSSFSNLPEIKSTSTSPPKSNNNYIAPTIHHPLKSSLPMFQQAPNSPLQVNQLAQSTIVPPPSSSMFSPLGIKQSNNTPNNNNNGNNNGLVKPIIIAPNSLFFSDPSIVSLKSHPKTTNKTKFLEKYPLPKKYYESTENIIDTFGGFTKRNNNTVSGGESGNLLSQMLATSKQKEFEERERLKISNNPLMQVYIQHINTLVGEQLEKNEIDPAWRSIIMDQTKRACDFVKISVNKGDKMSTNEYIKIKKIPGGNRSECNYIDGVVMTKILTHKKMKDKFSNPKILLLSCSVEFQRVENKFLYFDQLLQQEKEYLRILVSKIAERKPDLVLVEKTVSRHAQDFLLDAGISLALNVKPKLLERLGRCLGGEVLPTLDIIYNNNNINNSNIASSTTSSTTSTPNSNSPASLSSSTTNPTTNSNSTTLGSCGQFKVITYSEVGLKEKGQLGKKTLMYFERCPAALGATITIRGEELETLKIIKKILKFAIYSLHHAYLELKYLMDQSSTSNILFVNNNGQNLSCSPQIKFTLPKTYPTIPWKYKFTSQHIPVKKALLSSFYKPHSDTGQQQSVIQWTSDDEVLGIGTSDAFKSTDMRFPIENESILDHQSIVFSHSIFCNSNQCIPFEIHSIDYYTDNDLTLGEFLSKFCFSFHVCNIKECNRPLIEHERTFMNSTTRINICIQKTQTIQDRPTTTSPQNRLNQPIQRAGINVINLCKVCNKFSPESQLSTEAWEMSFGKFLELCFFGFLPIKTGITPECTHNAAKDHISYFYYQDLAAIFSYEPLPSLELSLPPKNLKSSYTEKQKQTIRVKELELMNQCANQVYSAIHERLFELGVENQDRIQELIPSLVQEKQLICNKIETLLQQPISFHKSNESIINLTKVLYANFMTWNSQLTGLVDSTSFHRSKRNVHQSLHQQQQMLSTNINNSGDGINHHHHHDSPYVQKINQKQQSHNSILLQSIQSNQDQQQDEIDQTNTSNEQVNNEQVNSTTTATATPSITVVNESSNGTVLPTPTVGATIIASPQLLSPSAVLLSTSGSNINNAFANAPNNCYNSVEQDLTLPLNHQSLNFATGGFTSMNSSTSSNGISISTPATPTPTTATTNINSMNNSNNGIIPVGSFNNSAGNIIMNNSGGNINLVGSANGGLSMNYSPNSLGMNKDATKKPQLKIIDTIAGIVSSISQTKILGPTMPYLLLESTDNVALFENEPSTTIAYTLSSGDFKTALNTLLEEELKKISEIEKQYEQLQRPQSVQIPQPTPLSHPLSQSTNSHFASPKSTPSTSSNSLQFNNNNNDPLKSEANDITRSRGSIKLSGSPISISPLASSFGDKRKQSLSSSLSSSSNSNSPISSILEKEKKFKSQSPISISNNAFSPSPSSLQPIQQPSPIVDHIDSKTLIEDLNIVDPQSSQQHDDNSPEEANKFGDYESELVYGSCDNESITSDTSESSTNSNIYSEKNIRLSKLMVSTQRKEIRSRFKFEKNGYELNIFCASYYPVQFHALREYICGDQEFIQSLTRSKVWNAKGGKSGSSWNKTLDDRFILKQVSRIELESFLDFAPLYFEYICKSYLNQIPSALCKILGVFTVRWKDSNGKSLKKDLIVMENLFYNKSISKTYDLKGSLRGRLVKNESEVLLDENLLQASFASPICLGEYDKTRIALAVWNDTAFLSSLNVMDYSLLSGIDNQSNQLVVGIIDYMRKFTWDKALEMKVKQSGIMGGGGKVPTVISPKQYKIRFRDAMWLYFTLSPDKFTKVNHLMPFEKKKKLIDDNNNSNNNNNNSNNNNGNNNVYNNNNNYQTQQNYNK